ncbi:MAG TPA: hypothetical protein VK879_20065 [Candidatus Sulfomarinibacteraceae bacterium]|nr:hypothetical protein [Candidatus Sulfomarinibacteraceae bacterium]
MATYDKPGRVAPAPQKSDSTDSIAMIIEIIFGIFGVLGMGWLYAGNIAVGVAAFLGFLILIGLEFVGLFVTFGIAACLIIPVNIAIAAISGIKVRDYVRNTGAQGNVLYVIIAAVGGPLLACGALFLLTMLLGGIGAVFEGMGAGGF